MKDSIPFSREVRKGKDINKPKQLNTESNNNKKKIYVLDIVLSTFKIATIIPNVQMSKWRIREAEKVTQGQTSTILRHKIRSV